MAPFRHDHDELEHGLLWLLMQSGPVTKCWQRWFFDEDIAELRALGIRVVRFDCAAWVDEDVMHEQLRSELEVPTYAARNLDALADSLSDAPVPSDGGMVVALDNFTESERSETLLRVRARASREWLLFGRVFGVVLAHRRSDLPRSARLGATPPQWNGREWLSARRGL